MRRSSSSSNHSLRLEDLVVREVQQDEQQQQQQQQQQQVSKLDHLDDNDSDHYDSDHYDSDHYDSDHYDDYHYHNNHYDDYHNETTTMASVEEELQELHQRHDDVQQQHQHSPRNRGGGCYRHHSFPPDCLTIVRLMKGNKTCVDCQGSGGNEDHDDKNTKRRGTGSASTSTTTTTTSSNRSLLPMEPFYASITHGTLLCRYCAAGHVERDERAFGILSFTDDSWGLLDVLALLEGGNSRFREFCAITNAYPTLESAVSDRTQFIDGLYASLPVKAYRSLLRKAVAKTQEEREGLIVSLEAQQQRRQRNHQMHPEEGMMMPSQWEPGGDEAQRYIKILPMLSVYEFYTTVLEKKWPGSEMGNEADEQVLLDDENGESNNGDGEEEENYDYDSDDESELMDFLKNIDESDDTIQKGSGSNRELLEEEKKDIADAEHHQDGRMQSSTRSGFDDGSESNDALDAAANGPLVSYDTTTAGENALLGGDDPFSGEAVVSLTGSDTTDKQSNLTEYVQSLNEEGTADGSRDTKRQGPQRVLRPMSSVDETTTDQHDGIMSVTSREEIVGSRTAIVRAGFDDSDSKSVVSSADFSVYSAGSSVGSLDLRSLPDGKSLSSADMEAILEVNDEDAMVKNLEPAAPAQDSFKNLETEELDGTTYGPEGTDDSAKDIHELEISNSSINRGDVNKDLLKGGKLKTSSLQRSMLKLDAAIGKVDPKQRHKLSVQRQRGNNISVRGLPSVPLSVQKQRGKNVSFRGLPSVPPERIENSVPNSRIQPIEKEMRRSNSLLGGFQMRGAARKSSEQTPNGNNGRTKRLPVATNGRMGPPVTKQSNYTPQMRYSPPINLQNGADDDQQQQLQQPQHRQVLEQQQATGPNRVVSAYKHQMRSIARNFNRQNSQQQQHAIPEYSDNMAARAQVEERDADPQQKQEQQPNGASNLRYGGLRSSSQQASGFFNFRSNSPQRGGNNREDNLASRFSQSLRGSFSLKDSA